MCTALDFATKAVIDDIRKICHLPGKVKGGAEKRLTKVQAHDFNIHGAKGNFCARNMKLS